MSNVTELSYTTTRRARITTSYGVYALAGLGGFLTIGIKEAVTQALLHSDTINPRYIPHTLLQEFQHAGLVHAPSAAVMPAIAAAEHNSSAHMHDLVAMEHCPQCKQLLASMPISDGALSNLQPMPAGSRPLRLSVVA